jgi:hypothetical protein
VLSPLLRPDDWRGSYRRRIAHDAAPFASLRSILLAI